MVTVTHFDLESRRSVVVVDAGWRPDLQDRTANQNPASPHPCRLDPWPHVTRGLHMARICGVGCCLRELSLFTDHIVTASGGIQHVQFAAPPEREGRSPWKC